jgi:murein DD-endopeptidase MepM/ murein hydrolase activator NlpD
MGKLTSETPLATGFLCRPHRLNFMGFFLVGLMILSCSGLPIRDARPRGVYHRVKSGETLSAIARAYRVDLQELAEINNISHSDRIEPDSVIFVPDANQILDDIMIAARPQSIPMGTSEADIPAVKAKPTAPVVPSLRAAPKRETAAEAEKHRERAAAQAAAKERAALARTADQDMASRKGSEEPESGVSVERPVKTREDEGKTGEIQFDRKRFIWPVSGRVVNKFGTESVMSDYNGRKVETAKIMNNGIKIAAGVGTPIMAAADGKVIYSMMHEKFGNTIIIEHADEFKTVYYDLGKRLVETSRRVKKGEPIATVAERVSKSEAFMSFEIRQKNKPRNPLFFLP